MNKLRTATVLMLAGATLLAGCELSNPAPPGPRPAPRPAQPAYAPSDASQAIATYYESVQRGLLTRGLLRTDGGGPDTPFSARDLVQNFARIALYQEYQDVNGRLVAREAAGNLHRWATPVRIQLQFGRSVAEDQRARDRTQATRLIARLARTTGHPISLVNSGANFTVLILDEDERRAFGPTLNRLVPGISNAAINHLINMPREDACTVFSTDTNDDFAPDRAVAVIRSEHPNLLRTACLHEEIAQGLGLPNDSPRARPSVFNDDEEFGLLTTHDELLLKMLYDPRLRPGMTETEARPIVTQIAAELTGGSV